MVKPLDNSHGGQKYTARTMLWHSNITFGYLFVVSPLLAQLNCGTNKKDSMNKSNKLSKFANKKILS